MFLLSQVVLLDEREQQDMGRGVRGPRILEYPTRSPPGCPLDRQLAVGVVTVVAGQADLDRDDGDHHQQLDQREAGALRESKGESHGYPFSKNPMKRITAVGNNR